MKSDCMVCCCRFLWTAVDNGTEERVVSEVEICHPAYFNRVCPFIIIVAITMFHRQQKWGLNTYLYAPKDDYKHRMFWRELYSVEEAGDF